jgi:hypothetical protein
VNTDGRAAKTIFVVHGVGPFSQEEVVQEVKSAFADTGPFEVVAFNWDQEVARAFAPDSPVLNVGVLSEISLGFLNAANLGFLDGRPYVGLPRWVIGAQNCATLPAQIFGWLLLLLLLPHRLLPNAVWQGLHLSLAVFGSTLLLGALIAFDLRALTVCIRRALLTWIWPFVHFLAVPLGFGWLYVFVQLSLFSATLFFANHGDTLGRSSHWWSVPVEVVTSYASIVVILGVGIILARAVHMAVAFPLKAFADVFRYIGVPLYAARLQEGFVAEFRRVTEDRHHVILLTHSLGSVIAVDALRAHGDLSRNLRRLELVTMGSPLKRFFSTLFPDIFAAPEDLYAALAAHIPNFNWVNVYRPLDYIGARLSCGSVSPIRECRTVQSTKLHVGYWGDKQVVKLISDALDDDGAMAVSARLKSSQTASEAVGTASTEYPGPLKWLWGRRDWPLKALVGAIMVGLYMQAAITAARSWLPPRPTAQMTSWELSKALLSRALWFEDWPVQLLFGLLMCVSLGFAAWLMWKLWKSLVVPYCESLFGRLSAPPTLWGARIAMPQVRKKMPSWARPPVVIGVAGVIVLSGTVSAIVTGAEWTRVLPPTVVGFGVSAMAFADRDHLLLARGDEIKELSVDGSRPQRVVPFIRLVGNAPVIQLSPSGLFVAGIDHRTLEASNNSGIPNCVWAAALPRNDESPAPPFFQDCTRDRQKRPVDVAVSNKGYLAVRYGNSYNNSTLLILYRGGTKTILDETSEGIASSGTLKFDPASECLGWQAFRKTMFYCSPSWKPRLPLPSDRAIDSFALAGLSMVVVATPDPYPTVSVIQSDGKLIDQLTQAGGKWNMPMTVTMSADRERIALVYDNVVTVWRWRTRDYWASTTTVLSSIFALDAWRALYDYLYEDESDKRRG